MLLVVSFTHTLTLNAACCTMQVLKAPLLHIALTEYSSRPRLSHKSHWLISHYNYKFRACVLSSLGALAKQILAANTLTYILSTVAVAVVVEAAAAAAAATQLPAAAAAPAVASK